MKRLHGHRRAIAISACLIFCLLLAGSRIARAGSPASATTGANYSGSPVLTDARDQCPLHYDSNPHTHFCKMTKFGNAASYLFDTQYGDWGITYAYNCGKVNDFGVVVGLPNFDGDISQTGFWRHGRSGKGYVMETGIGVKALKKLRPAFWGQSENIEMDSSCAWHVRAIKGNGSIVSQHIPRIPRYTT